MKSNKELKQAHDKLDTLSNDEYLQRIADLRQKAILDRNAQLSTSYRKGVEEGIETGIEKGIANEKIETAKKMLQENIDVSIINKVTGLPIDKINKLKNEK